MIRRRIVRSPLHREQDFLHNFCRKSLHNHDRIQMRRGEHHLMAESGLGCNIYRPAWTLFSTSSVLRCPHLNAIVLHFRKLINVTA